MSTEECPRCTRPAPGGTCWLCVRDLLNCVDGLLDDLHTTLSKQDRFAPTASGRRTKTTAPLPIRLDVPEVIWTLGNVLTTWARDTARKLGITVDARHLARPIYVPAHIRQRHTNGTPAAITLGTDVCPTSDLPRAWCAHCLRHQLPVGIDPDDELTTIDRPRDLVPAGQRWPTPFDTLRFAASWLAEHLEEIRQLDDAAELAEEITDAIEAALRTVDIPTQPRLLGKCEMCDTALYVEPDDTEATCAGCGVTFTNLAAIKDSALFRIRAYPATALFIATVAAELDGQKLRYNTINVWASRGKIRMVDRDPETKAPRYRIGQVLDYAREQERKRRRGPAAG